MLDSKCKVIIMEPITIVLIAAASFVLVAMMVFFAIKPRKASETNSSYQNGIYVGKTAPWANEKYVPAPPAKKGGDLPVNGESGRPYFKNEG